MYSGVPITTTSISGNTTESPFSGINSTVALFLLITADLNSILLLIITAYVVLVLRV